MINIYPLFSGSSGNCILIESNSTCILLDAGVSAKRIGQALKMIDKTINDISYILISHEHKDHILGIDILLKNNDNIKVCASEKTWQVLEFKNIYEENKITFKPECYFVLDDITIYPFPISHDAVEPCGFNFISKDNKISCVTDLGYMSDDIKKLLNGSSTVYLEANHEIDMVKTSNYPYPLKRRILGEAGHLSNIVSAETICYLAKSGTHNFILGHLSDMNNSPEIALQVVDYELVRNNINKENIDISVACKSII